MDALLDFPVFDEEVKAAVRYVQADAVAVSDGGQRAARSGLWSDMDDYGPECGSAHAGVA